MGAMRTILLLAAAVLISLVGYLHGSWTNRWGANEALTGLARRFATVPASVGDWTSVDVPFSERELKQAGATSSLVRRYTNRVTGEVVSIFVIAGLPSDIAAHTPEVCYPGAGYVLGETVRVEVPGVRNASLRTAEAVNDQPGGPGRIRLFWGWDSGDGWNAPEDARGLYTGLPALCKLYATRAVVGNSIPSAGDPTLDLLRLLLPQLDASLFGPGTPTGVSPSDGRVGRDGPQTRG
jgi:hypothetical protein